MRKVIFAIILTFYGLAVFVSDARTRAEEQKKRADYYYMEALRQNALENNDMYFKLMERANQLDPKDVSIGSDLGFFIVMLADNDSVWRQKGVDLIHRYVEKYPEDVYSGLAYYSIMRRGQNQDEALRVINRLDSLYPEKPEIGYRLAEQLTLTMDSASMMKAVDVLDRLEQSVGKQITFSLPKLKTYLTLKDTVSAEKELNSLIKDNPDNIEVLAFAGDVFLELNKKEEALEYYDRACRTDSTSGMAFYKRAAYYQATGDTARYEKEIVEAVGKEGLDPEIRIELLRTLVVDMIADSTRHNEIVKIFDDAVAKMPHEAPLRKMYATYFYTVKDYPLAAEQLGYALDIDHGAPEDWMQLADLYSLSGNRQQQLEALKNGIRYFPDNGPLMVMESSVYLMDKEYDKALEKAFEGKEILEKAGADPSQLSSVVGLIGDIYQQKEMTDSAFSYYEKALELDPNNTLVMNNYAYFLACEDKDLDKALALSMRSVAETPDNGTNLDTYAWVLFKQQKYDEALKTIRKVLSLMEEKGDTPSAEVFEHAGDICFFNKLHKEAVEYWKKALEIDPDSELLKKKVANKTYFYENQ